MGILYFPPAGWTVPAADPRRAIREPERALIADCGHPRWPGWIWLAALLIAAQIAASAVSVDQPARLRSHRDGGHRISAGPRAARIGRSEAA